MTSGSFSIQVAEISQQQIHPSLKTTCFNPKQHIQLKPKYSNLIFI